MVKFHLRSRDNRKQRGINNTFLFVASMAILGLVLFTTAKSTTEIFRGAMILTPQTPFVQHDVFDSMIKMHQSISGTGKSWKVVNWKNPITKEEEEKFSCDFVKFTSSTSGNSAQMCVHPHYDSVSKSIRKHGRLGDCVVLPKIWNDSLSTRRENSVYVEIGANIGACVMEMLLGTDAKIIAFEPHPMNLFNLKKTVSQLDSSLQDRLCLIPIGIGHKQETSTIYSPGNNMGNSNIGMIVKDNLKQVFDEKLQFDVNVERLGSILSANDMHVDLMKIDAQGFECNIFEGIGKEVASTIDAIKFEYAPKWLRAQKCADLLPRMRNFGFNIYKQYVGGNNYTELIDIPRRGLSDMYAVKPNTHS